MEEYDVVVVGSGEAGKYLAWTLAKAGQRTALVERSLIGGSCPNIVCLPTKNIVHSAKIAAFTRRAHEFGLDGGPLTTDWRGVIARKRQMVAELVDLHLARFREIGVDLIMGSAQFIGEKTVQVNLNSGGSCVLVAQRLFLNLGTRTAMPPIPGITDAKPLTHIELLELERLPTHLIILGGGYIGIEFAQALRRFGAEVTVIQKGPQLAAREDADVGHFSNCSAGRRGSEDSRILRRRGSRGLRTIASGAGDRRNGPARRDWPDTQYQLSWPGTTWR